MKRIRTLFPKGVISTQTTGNVGLYYVCYKLSLHGWNVMPTARNAKGVDLVAYNQAGNRKYLLQVKTLSYRNNVPLGSNLDTLIADYLIVCVRESNGEISCFILTPEEVRENAGCSTAKSGGKSWWLDQRYYYRDDQKNNWPLLGTGA